jgi:hypothetical protein
VLISIHGGPEAQARPGFIGRRNYFVNVMGIALIEPNCGLDRLRQDLRRARQRRQA